VIAAERPTGQLATSIHGSSFRRAPSTWGRFAFCPHCSRWITRANAVPRRRLGTRPHPEGHAKCARPAVAAEASCSRLPAVPGRAERRVRTRSGSGGHDGSHHRSTPTPRTSRRYRQRGSLARSGCAHDRSRLENSRAPSKHLLRGHPAAQAVICCVALRFHPPPGQLTRSGCAGSPLSARCGLAGASCRRVGRPSHLARAFRGTRM
jgi:hypothetical protein